MSEILNVFVAGACATGAFTMFVIGKPALGMLNLAFCILNLWMALT